MKISTILEHIDSGHMALPEFQRGYVWNRDQVRGLFDSLYRRHPVGGLLVWARPWRWISKPCKRSTVRIPPIAMATAANKRLAAIHESSQEKIRRAAGRPTSSWTTRKRSGRGFRWRDRRNRGLAEAAASRYLLP